MKLTKIASIALATTLSYGAMAQDVEINGSVVNQAAAVQNQVTLAFDDAEAFTRINSIQDTSINGSVVNQAAAVQNQVTLAFDDACAETTINSIGQPDGC